MNHLVTPQWVFEEWAQMLRREIKASQLLLKKLDQDYVVGSTVYAKLPQRYAVADPAPQVPFSLVASGVAVAVVAKAALSSEKISRRRFFTFWRD